MILAAADFANDNTTKPPPELLLALSCERWTSLPESGGILDQPAGLLKKMGLASNVYHAFKSYGEAKEKDKWIEQVPDAWELVSWVVSLQMERDKNG